MDSAKFTTTTPDARRLDGSLILKSLSNPADVDRIAAFNGHIHGLAVAGLTRHLILDHPHTRPDEWLYIEDESTGQIIATLCLIPWEWQIDGVTLRSGEMGIVGTSEAYRRRGLNRALTERFMELIRRDGYDLSHIQGIPYFYRQFGYEYAMPLEGGWRVELYQVSPLSEEARRFTWRLATEADIPHLMPFAQTAAQSLLIHARRDAEVWRFLLGPSLQTEYAADTYLLLEGDQPCGYWRISRHGFGEGVILAEASALPYDGIRVALNHAKQVAQAQNKPYIRLNLPRTHSLVTAARHDGAYDLGTYAWQIHLPNIAQLLTKLGPAFEKRLLNTPFAGLTQTFTIHLYREAFALNFNHGRLESVGMLGAVETGDLQLPPQAFTPLILGQRSRDQLREMYPDVSCASGQAYYLTDVLFPKGEAFLYSIY